MLPGYVSVLREWLRKYKLIDGKPENKFGLDERAMDKAYTMDGRHWDGVTRAEGLGITLGMLYGDRLVEAVKKSTDRRPILRYVLPT